MRSGLVLSGAGARGAYQVGGLFIVVGGIFAVTAGCGPTVHVGLSNSPSVTRQSQPKQTHDAIANGPEASGSSAAPEATPRHKH
jgi:hypothetical protein